MDRILLASDLTARSEQAIARACRLARQHHAALRLVHVVDPDASVADRALARTRLHDQVEPHVGAPQGAELEFASTILAGETAAELVEEAGTFAPDLVVIGGHARPRLRDALFGTTATRLLQHLDAPLLAVRGDAAAPYRRLLIALEGDENACLLRTAAAIARPSDVFVVHATDAPLDTLFGDGELAEPAERLQTRRVRDAFAAGLLPDQARITAICQEAEPLDLLGSTWTEARPELLVMGTHGRTGLARLLRGSEANAALIGYPADILVMRTSAPAVSRPV
jgi:universal stress protein E